jgi:hypothetical protein
MKMAKLGHVLDRHFPKFFGPAASRNMVFSEAGPRVFGVFFEVGFRFFCVFPGTIFGFVVVLLEVQEVVSEVDCRFFGVFSEVDFSKCPPDRRPSRETGCKSAQENAQEKIITVNRVCVQPVPRGGRL